MGGRTIGWDWRHWSAIRTAEWLVVVSKQSNPPQDHDRTHVIVIQFSFVWWCGNTIQVDTKQTENVGFGIDRPVNISEFSSGWILLQSHYDYDNRRVKVALEIFMGLSSMEKARSSIGISRISVSAVSDCTRDTIRITKVKQWYIIALNHWLNSLRWPWRHSLEAFEQITSDFRVCFFRDWCGTRDEMTMKQISD